MPYGIKLETEENVMNAIGIAKQQSKKAPKHKPRYYDSLNAVSNDNYNQPRKARERKPNFNIQNITNTKSNIKNSISDQCKKGFDKIRHNPLSQQFYINSSSDSPSLSIIERKIKNNKYNSVSEFTLDLRNVWTFYFQNYTTNPDPDLYQKVLKMSQLSEEIGKELQNNEDNRIKNSSQDVNKKLANIKKEVKDIKTNYHLSNPKRNDHSIHIMDKPLSSQEKIVLSNNIRSLNHEQLMGIIKILGNTKEIETNKSHLEFDIEKLPVRLLRELEKYTNNCLKNHLSKQKANEDVQKGKNNQSSKKESVNLRSRPQDTRSQVCESLKNQLNECIIDHKSESVNNTQQEPIKSTISFLMTNKPKSVLDASFDMESISSDSSSSLNSDLSSN